MTTGGPAFVEPVEGVVLPPAPPEDKPDTVDLRCEDCGEHFVGKPGGPNSAPMQLGRHRRSKHGEGKAGKPARVEREPETVAAAVADAGAAVPGKGTPTVAGLASFGGALVKHASRAAAGWAYDSTPDTTVLGLPPDPAERAPTINALSIPQSTAETIVRPLARLVQPTALNRKYGRKLVEHTDVLPAVEALAEVARNWGEFLRTRRELVRALRAHQLQAVPMPAPAPAPATPPPAPMSPEMFGPVDPFLGAGTVAAPTR